MTAAPTHQKKSESNEGHIPAQRRTEPKEHEATVPFYDDTRRKPGGWEWDQPIATDD
jgi:hypothetical protein